MKKVIFLDIDGVLATESEFFTNRTNFQKKNEVARELRIPYPFNVKAVDVFNTILDETDAEIVLSSDWRTHWNLEELDGIFKFNVVKKSPIDVTSNIVKDTTMNLEEERTYQINLYVEEHKLENWVAIDDLKLDLDERFFKTKSNMGIKQTGLKDKIINKLNS